MKKMIYAHPTCLLVSIFFAINGRAQNEYGHVYQRYNYDAAVPVMYAPPVPVGSITFTVVTKGKNKKSKIYYKEYTNNRQLSAMYQKKNGVLIPVAKYQYDERGKCIADYKYKRGKLISTVIYRYNTSGKPLLYEYRSGSNQLTSRTVWKYNEDSCVKEMLYYKSETGLKKRWEYTYYDSAKLEKTMLYNRKGKLIQQWLFTCKSEGEQLTPKKNTEQVCTWNQESATTISKTYETFNEKGKTLKQVYMYNAADTSVIEWQLYKNNELKRKTTYDGDFSRPLKDTWYKKGKAFAENICSYMNGLKTSSEYTWKGKTTSKTTYYYNESSLLTEYIEYGKGGKEKVNVTLAYP